MLAGYDKIPILQPVTGVAPGDQECITVFADSAFDLPWDAYPVSHGDISDELHVTPAALRVLWKLGFCKLKKPPHALDCYILNKVFLLFSGYFRHW